MRTCILRIPSIPLWSNGEEASNGEAVYSSRGVKSFGACRRIFPRSGVSNLNGGPVYFRQIVWLWCRKSACIEFRDLAAAAPQILLTSKDSWEFSFTFGIRHYVNKWIFSWRNSPRRSLLVIDFQLTLLYRQDLKEVSLHRITNVRCKTNLNSNVNFST